MYRVEQREMMTAARRRHVQQVSLWLGVIAVLGLGGYGIKRFSEQRNKIVAAELEVKRLLDAKMTEAVKLSSELQSSILACQGIVDTVHGEKEPLTRRVRAAFADCLYRSAGRRRVDELSVHCACGRRGSDCPWWGKGDTWPASKSR
jgi:hypothetical protein